MTWYGRAQAIEFVLILVGGLILSAKAVWFLVSGAFIIGLVVQVCFVSPYQHAKKLQSGLDDQSGRVLDKASELLKRPSQLQPFQGLYAAGVADLETNAQVVLGADKLSEHHEHPMQWMEK